MARRLTFLFAFSMRAAVAFIAGLCVVASPASAAGALNVGVQLEPPNLDPTSGAAAAIDEIVYANIFEGLTRITEDGAAAPALATDWTISADGRVYEFKLRRDVRFHDGAKFNADAVVFTFDRARGPTSTNAQRPIFEQIKTVTAVDPFTVRITLKQPLGAFPIYLGWGDAVIVARTSAATNASHPIGTGPFKFQRWRKGASITLVRNDDYWGTRPPLDQINFIFIPDPTAAFAALLAGDVDGFPNYPAAENLALIERDQRFQIVFGAGEGEMLVAINNAKPPFDDIRVRRALNHAIDKQAVIDAGLFGYGTPLGSHFSPHHPAYIDLSNRYIYDPVKARRLLSLAGVGDGFALTLTLPPPAYARRGGEVIAAQLEAVGIDVTIRNLEWAQWLDQVFSNKSYDLTIVSHTEPLDTDIYARDDYYFQYKNENFNRVISLLRETSGADERNQLYGEAQRILANDAVNVWIASSPKIAVWSRDISGVWADAPLQANDFTRADIANRAPVLAAKAAKPAFPVFAIWLIAAAIGAAAIYFSRASPAFLLSRFAGMAATLAAASVVIFLLIEVAPGDPAAFMMGLNADPASIAALKAELGLDQPTLVRYFTWIGGLASGDFGVSYTYRVPVADLIAERFWVSLPLALLAFLISTVIGIPAGVMAAARRGRASGRAIITAAQAGVAVPNFWLAILLVLVFAVGLRWFSAGGFPGWDAGALPGLKALFLPAIALALPQAAILTQIMRTSMLDVMDNDYIRTARAKGLSQPQVLRRHALRNAMIPVLTILGLQFGFLLAGSIIVENVFYLPGLGRLVFQSIVQRDLIVVKSIVIVLVFIVILTSFFIDLAYGVVDPRLRRRGAS
jgi:peptide/nickel transport system substrate-binding protein